MAGEDYSRFKIGIDRCNFEGTVAGVDYFRTIINRVLGFTDTRMYVEGSW